MKKQCLIIFILTCLQLNAQSYCNDSIGALNSKGKKIGLWRYYNNHKLIYTEEFDNGILNGRKVVFGSKKKVKIIIEYCNNQVHGSVKFFDNKGKLIRDHHYQNNELNGTSYDYYSNGKIKYVYNFMNGFRHGDFIMYSGDTVAARGHYVANEMDGVFYKWFSKDIKVIEVFSHGKILENRKEINSEGVLLREDIFDSARNIYTVSNQYNNNGVVKVFTLESLGDMKYPLYGEWFPFVSLF